MLLYYSIITESMDSSNSNEYGAFIGRVDWFDSRKGYGFVVDMTDGSDDSSNSGVFVHYSDIVVNNEHGVYRKLHPGEYVSFDKGDRDDKVVCLNVRGVNGGPLLTENTGYRYKVFRNHNDVEDDEVVHEVVDEGVVDEGVVDEGVVDEGVVDDEDEEVVYDDQDPESEQ
jgi:cold shock CspA family protein